MARCLEDLLDRFWALRDVSCLPRPGEASLSLQAAKDAAREWFSRGLRLVPVVGLFGRGKWVKERMDLGHLVSGFVGFLLMSCFFSLGGCGTHLFFSERLFSSRRTSAKVVLVSPV